MTGAFEPGTGAVTRRQPVPTGRRSGATGDPDRLSAAGPTVTHPG